ncbi:MAG: GH3 auxin-responsive promoter family protein [Chloroflexi bacterium]|nr:GH3 auxin-responsive promoter family protein [Chloroflexota bacterium]
MLRTEVMPWRRWGAQASAGAESSRDGAALQRDPILLHGPASQVWEKYCGFLSMSRVAFDEVQELLLREHVRLFSPSAVAKRVLSAPLPEDPEVLRRTVPFTTYEDYSSVLLRHREQDLPERPLFWAYTSTRGRDGKLIPFTQRAYERVVDTAIASVLLSCARRPGEVAVSPGERILYSLAPRPYLSGYVVEGIHQRTGWQAIPPLHSMETLDFRARLEMGFRLALRSGVDVISAMTPVLVHIGQRFAEEASSHRSAATLLHPGIALRAARAFLGSRMAGRRVLPKDLWPAKAVIGWGLDSAFYREKVVAYWGREPYEFFAISEVGIMAVQDWTRRGLVFSPFAGFLEFIPEAEARHSRETPGEVPTSYLLTQLREGETYELVFTSFYGMPFLRYRTGYLLRVLPGDVAGDGKGLPLLAVAGHADGIIDLAGFTRLDAVILQEALRAASLETRGWVARREFRETGPVLHLFMESPRQLPVRQMEERLHQTLKGMDEAYRNVEELLALRPLRVTLVPPGRIRRLAGDQGLPEGRECAGAWRVDPPEGMVQGLLSAS